MQLEFEGTCWDSGNASGTAPAWTHFTASTVSMCSGQGGSSVAPINHPGTCPNMCLLAGMRIAELVAGHLKVCILARNAYPLVGIRPARKDALRDTRHMIRHRCLFPCQLKRPTTRVHTHTRARVCVCVCVCARAWARTRTRARKQ
jgi:hypothetical protein